MNNKEYLLTCLMEECAEATQAASKYLRFGRDSTFAGYPTTNEDYLVRELGDIVALVELLQEEGIIYNVYDPNHIDAKKIKVKEFRERSRQLGLVFT